MSLSLTPNMALQKAEPLVTPGPDWAELINTMIDRLDAHDHSAGRGARITPSGLNLNADVTLQGNYLVAVKAARLQSQSAALAAAADTGEISNVGGNLYWNNNAGVAVQITNGTAVNTSISNAFATSTPGAYPYTVSAADAQKILLIDASAARTVNLPAATTVVMFILKDIAGSSGTNAISVVPNGANTIDGINATRLLSDPFGAWMLISDGVNGWAIMSLPERTDPVGAIVMFGGASAPAGWMLCDGTAYSRATYSRLFDIIGTTYGVGDGSTTFNVPDLRQRFPIGKAASGTGSTLGGTGGSIDHTHSVPAHYHGMGTGADLNITSSGAHIHAIDHDHASVTSSGQSADHTHSIAHDHGAVTSAAGSAHTHSIDHDHAAFNSAAATPTTQLTAAAWVGSGVPGGDINYNANYVVMGAVADPATVTQPWGGHVHSVNVPNFTGTSGSESSHTHSVDLPNYTGNSGGVSAGHTHDVDLPAFTGNSTSVSHVHAAAAFAGSIGLVTGGVNGNAAMTSGTGNPPFIALNFIIKT